MINAYIPTNLNICSGKYKHSSLYNATHELFHIMYMKYVLKKKIILKGIVWYDEGYGSIFIW